MKRDARDKARVFLRLDELKLCTHENDYLCKKEKHIRETVNHYQSLRSLMELHMLYVTLVGGLYYRTFTSLKMKEKRHEG